MKERWITFNRNGDEFLDTVNEIAEALNVDRKTVMSTIKKLTENGVVEGYKGRLGSSNKWIWNNFNEFTLRG
jgi:DNA-binding Lrp family transcriptional regulator